MADFVFFYVHGNLDGALKYLTELNDLYRMHDSDKEFEECLIGLEQIATLGKCRSKVPKRLVRGLVLNLVPSRNGHRSLVLEGSLKALDGLPYEDAPMLRNNVTVKELGRRMIRKHGEYHVPELTSGFAEEFGPFFEKDSGTYELLMLEFFLKKLHLLNALDLRRSLQNL